MNHTEVLTRYTANFVDELVKSGLQEVVISPGSRSTPLALTFCKHSEVREWVIIDERSAAFFALGMAKETGRPVALLCTSGTATANYYPAIVEAHYSRVPLIVLTADRPHELRGIGAPQSIEQTNLYGDYVKWFHEMALPEASPKMLGYVRAKASHAMEVAASGNAGPVQLNFPFREPLTPDFSIDDLWGEQRKQNYNPLYHGKSRLDSTQINAILKQIATKPHGVIVCGPQVNEELAKTLTDLASLLNIPILADPLSQLRAGSHNKATIIESYDAIFRSKQMRANLKPDYIIRFGAMPVSKAYLFYVEEHQDVPQFVIEDNEGIRDPSANRTTFIYADPIMLCNDMIEQVKQANHHGAWLNRWQEVNHIAKEELLADASTELTEGETVLGLLSNMPCKSTLYVGNSMAVRDLDTFFMTTSKDIKILANRGANGIDGMNSSALGAAATSKVPVTLLVGDLSFYHDLNGLLTAKKYALDLTILLINNNGGGIFSFLPQARDDQYFETLFGTPLDIEFEQTITMYGGSYNVVTDSNQLNNALIESYQYKGLSVIEVKTDRVENATWHRRKWDNVSKKLVKDE